MSNHHCAQNHQSHFFAPFNYFNFCRFNLPLMFNFISFELSYFNLNMFYVFCSTLFDLLSSTLSFSFQRFVRRFLAFGFMGGGRPHRSNRSGENNYLFFYFFIFNFLFLCFYFLFNGHYFDFWNYFARNLPHLVATALLNCTNHTAFN